MPAEAKVRARSMIADSPRLVVAPLFPSLSSSWSEVVNDRYSFFAHLQIPIICRSDIADYRHGADYLQIGHFICRYPFYLQIWSISADNLQVKKE